MNPIEVKLFISFNFIISFKAVIFSDVYSMSALNIKSLNNTIVSKSDEDMMPFLFLHKYSNEKNNILSFIIFRFFKKYII